MFTNPIKLICEKAFRFALRYQEAKDPLVLNKKKQTDQSQLDNGCASKTKDEEFKPFSIKLNKDEELREEISELKSVYKLSIETRNFEISNLIHRNNFFMLFQGVLLGAVFSNQASKPYVEFIICLMGFFISWHQIKVAAGAKYWQEWWEVRTSDIEKKLKDKMVALSGKSDGFISLFDFDDTGDKSLYEQKVKNKTLKKNSSKSPELFENISKALIGGRYSVSRVPITSGIILLITWGALFISTVGLADSIALTSSQYELCISTGDHCGHNSSEVLDDLWKNLKLVNGHYFADNEEPPTQIIFNQYNQN
ncbi:hypothetical protein [Acinetobacter sp. ANC 5045]|uniref:RipA family octameric membrane protein n=1 Tax=Acinetobacter sp. ANC 5045 TaxID=2529851 RepID=UPI001BC879C5|nr:hypothetical protein [Acinetobacter sp. ANC 5045]